MGIHVSREKETGAVSTLERAARHLFLYRAVSQIQHAKSLASSLVIFAVE